MDSILQAAAGSLGTHSRSRATELWPCCSQLQYWARSTLRLASVCSLPLSKYWILNV